jgi:hypothetical protein
MGPGVLDVPAGVSILELVQSSLLHLRDLLKGEFTDRRWNDGFSRKQGIHRGRCWPYVYEGPVWFSALFLHRIVVAVASRDQFGLLPNKSSL